MKWTRLLLIAFFGNYIINNVVAALVTAAVPASTTGSTFLSPQYIVFVLVSAISTGLLAWWYLNPMPKMDALKWGAIFGIGGFIVAILTTFVSGISGVLAQTGSFAQVGAVLPNFGPYILNWSTLVLLGFWVIPGVLVGYYCQWKAKKGMPQSSAMPM